MVVYSDGIAEPVNPGQAAWGFVLVVDGTAVERRGGSLEGRRTNNEAEYEACLQGVQRANELYPDLRKRLRSDSQLVIRQLAGQYEVRSPRMAPYHERIIRLLDQTWRVEWIPREQNDAADHESRVAFWNRWGKWPLRGRLVASPPVGVALPATHVKLEVT